MAGLACCRQCNIQPMVAAPQSVSVTCCGWLCTAETSLSRRECTAGLPTGALYGPAKVRSEPVHSFCTGKAGFQKH